MIEVYEYSKGKIIETDFENLSNNKTWIRIIDPDEDKLNLIKEKTGIPIEELEETIEEDERPKVETGRYIEIIYRAPIVEEGDIKTTPFYIYILANKIVTIERDKVTAVAKLATCLKNQKEKEIFKEDLPYIAYHLLDKINDDFVSKIDIISRQIDIYEDSSNKILSNKDMEKLYDQSVALTIFNQGLIANVEVLNVLRKSKNKKFDNENRELFNELYYDALQLLDNEKIQRENVSNLFNLQSILSSSRLNISMKKLTYLAIIFSVPTIISGIYGMNVKLPFGNHPYGFHIIILIMVIMIFVTTKLLNKIK
jgi:magnesium transporter